MPPPTLPIINIEPYINLSNHSDNERRATSEALHIACRDYGFFYLNVECLVSSREVEELFELSRAFFALPQEDKDAISIRNEDNARGYQRLSENVTGGKADAHEAIDLYRPVENPDRTKPLWGTNQWPEKVPLFREKHEIWIEKMKGLGEVMIKAMAVGLGATPEETEDLIKYTDDPFWVVRIIGYPPIPNDHDGFSCGAHKDYGCLTFLLTDSTQDALQVLVPKSLAAAKGFEKAGTANLPDEATDDGVWIYANPIPGCFVCNIGEIWEIWTRGMYKSTLHRVLHKGSNYRVSLPFFYEPNFDAQIKPLISVVRAQDASGIKIDGDAYRPVNYGEFLKKKVGANFADDTPGKGRY